MRIVFYCASYESERRSQIPLGVAALGAYLEQQGLADARDIRYAATGDEAARLRPDCFCVSSTSQVIDDAYHAADTVKAANPHALCILGGYHVTAVPRHLAEPFAVAVCGEGERTLAELVRLAGDGRCSEPHLADVQGICYRDAGGRVQLTPRRPLIEDLDALPLPHRRPVAPGEEPFVFSSRGCPYRCIYCASSVHWGRCRYHSAARVVEEIELLHVRHGVRRIVMADDLFAASKRRLADMIALLDQRGLLGRVQFHGFVRANLVDEEMAALLKRMGFWFVRFGAESASQRVLTKLKCGTVQVEQAQRTVDLCHAAGLKVGASFVFGTPGETEADMEASFDFLRRNRGRCVLAGFYLLTPYPGTALWDWAAGRGIVGEQMDWTRLALDFQKPEFDWPRAVYLNEECIPRGRFREIIEGFKAEFLAKKPVAAVSDTFSRSGEKVSDTFSGAMPGSPVTPGRGRPG